VAPRSHQTATPSLRSRSPSARAWLCWARGGSDHSAADIDCCGLAWSVRARHRISTFGAQPISGLDGYWSLFGSWRGVRFVTDLSGLAIAGGLFIVPVLLPCSPGPAPTAVPGGARQCAQCGLHGRLGRCDRGAAGRRADHTGRVPAAWCRSLLVAVAIGRTMPANALKRMRSRSSTGHFFRIELKGLENLHNAGPNVIIALNM